MFPQLDKLISLNPDDMLFPGFTRPESNYYRLPNDWFDIWQKARRTLADGNRPARIVAPLKVVEYIIKHSWGWQNFSEPIRLTRAELRQGRQNKKHKQLDRGTGLGSQATISRGIELAIELGLLEQHCNNSDQARQTRHYLPRLALHSDNTELPSDSAEFTGFNSPTQNYFVVPKIWSDMAAGLKSEVQILVIEYFFRHTWGWQMRNGEVRWLDADEVANGRRYRSPERDGERYDRGTGYSTRQVRDALTAGVKTHMLVWHRNSDGQREYALRLKWMTGIIDGYYDPAPVASEEPARLMEKSVPPTEKPVHPTEKGVPLTEKPVRPAEKSVPLTEKPVDRTYKDTSDKTLVQNTPEKTAATKHRATPPDAAADLSKSDDFKIYFRLEQPDGTRGEAQRLTIPAAVEAALTQNGVFYWSDADLANPRDVETGEPFTTEELVAQLTLDAEIFGNDYGLLRTEGRWAHRSLLDLAQQNISITYDLWQLLDLPFPPQLETELNRRRRLFEQLKAQHAAWGHPSLIRALEQFGITPAEARSLIDHYSPSLVGGWLRLVRQRRNHLHNPAGLLIKKLRNGEPPPGGPMMVAYHGDSPIPPMQMTGLLQQLLDVLRPLDDPRLADLTAAIEQATKNSTLINA